jgi:hypothetical protein
MRLPETDLADGPGKAEVVDARQQAFDFLVLDIRRARSRLTGNGYPDVEPGKRAEQRIKARIKGLAARRRAPAPASRLITGVNRIPRREDSGRARKSAPRRAPVSANRA